MEPMQSEPGNEALERALRNAHIFLRRGDLESAARECAAALEAVPESAEAHELMGDLLLQQGKKDDAAQSYRRAMALAPGAAGPETKYARLVLNLGEAAYQQEQMKAAMAHPASQKAGAHNSSLALLATLLWPGLGHAYLGDTTRAMILAGSYGVSLLVLMITGDLPKLLAGFMAFMFPGGQTAAARASQVTVLAPLAMVAGAVWLYAFVDVMVQANKKGRRSPHDDYTEPNF